MGILFIFLLSRPQLVMELKAKRQRSFFPWGSIFQSISLFPLLPFFSLTTDLPLGVTAPHRPPGPFWPKAENRRSVQGAGAEEPSACQGHWPDTMPTHKLICHEQCFILCCLPVSISTFFQNFLLLQETSEDCGLGTAGLHRQRVGLAIEVLTFPYVFLICSIFVFFLQKLFDWVWCFCGALDP